MDDRAIDIFTAQNGGKHARDIYFAWWALGLGTEYSKESLVNIGAGNLFHHHNSLLSDDDVDGDSTRRGVPTFHNSEFLEENFPRRESDFTQTQVIKLMPLPYLEMAKSDLPDNHKVDVIRTLSTAVYRLGMGQIEDLAGPESMKLEDREIRIEYDDEEVDPMDWWYGMVANKASSLFEAAGNCGAIAAEYEGDEPREHGYETGILLQMTDDILDVTQDADSLGKDSMSDFVEGKPSYMAILALQYLEGGDWDHVAEVIQQEDPSEEDLGEARDLIYENGIVEMAYEDAERHYENAGQILDRTEWESPEYAEGLDNLGKMVLNRSM